MKQDKDKRKQLIRNSTAEFLNFIGQTGEQSIEARYEDRNHLAVSKADGTTF